MHKLSSTFILGYHGCYASIAEKLLAGNSFKKSENEYDWLGPGIYFWEANPDRGLEFVKEKLLREKKESAESAHVVGAIIELGNCLDLTTSDGVSYVKTAYGSLKKVTKKAGVGLPRNEGKDNLLRKLDCAVIRYLHDTLAEENAPPIDTVKGIFHEGDPLYENSGFYEKTHTQICVCNPAMIKGVFRVKI